MSRGFAAAGNMGNPTPAVKSLTAAAPLAEASKTPPNMANKWLWGQVIDFSKGGFANKPGKHLLLLEKAGEFVNPKCNSRSAPAYGILTAFAVPCGNCAALGGTSTNPLNDEDPGAAQSAGASAICRHRQMKTHASYAYTQAGASA